MGEKEIRAKYGGKLAKAINRAIRAEVPGGNAALDLLTQLSGPAMHSGWTIPNGDPTPEAKAYFKHKRDVVDKMEAKVRAHWQVPADAGEKKPRLRKSRAGMARGGSSRGGPSRGGSSRGGSSGGGSFGGASSRGGSSGGGSSRGASSRSSASRSAPPRDAATRDAAPRDAKSSAPKPRASRGHPTLGRPRKDE